MKVTKISDIVTRIDADEGMVLTDAERTFYSKIIYPAKSLTADDFIEVPESEIPQDDELGENT